MTAPLFFTYFKATRPDGYDIRTGTIDYAQALETGEVIEHPRKMVRDDPATYLSVSVHAANCTGMQWPCRLFRVEPVGRTLTASINDSKRACRALRVVEELPAHQALGPQGEQVAAVIERVRRLTAVEDERLAAAWDAARDGARDAAWDAAQDAARDAARNAAWNALALLTRDLISQEHYDTLIGPWRDVIGTPPEGE